ncbi:hypothetical protein BD410DRAFT_765043 [Rickenella mellea]|uniref:RNI-like protein n=1 Tax=Rickenella mellea TaxID=50990 RepID=A0A4Y7QE60_9AGAM|nr:hypothetical protein BD410DRAFT_765043 [Rickenella mellea]
MIPTVSCVDKYPPELLFSICAAVYSAGQPVADQSLDPFIYHGDATPTALPSSHPAPHWPEPIARKTLANICLVNHAWYEAAKPWLWCKVEIRYPSSWLSFLTEIGGGDEEISEEEVGISIKEATHAALAAKSFSGSNPPDDDAARKLHESIIAELSGPDGSIPPELLSPPASREPSPRRLRTKSKSPARWKIMRSISDAVQNFMELDDPGFYVPTPHDPSAGRHVCHLDFNHFRTIGMRRSVGEGVHSRFVTGERVEAVLKETPNLTAFGATEYMDGALTLPVLKELFLRGSPSRGRGRPSRGRTSPSEAADTEEEDRERRRECRDLVAIDLTGCVSAVFFNSLTEFVNTYVLESDNNGVSAEVERGRVDRHSRSGGQGGLSFPGVQRLGLRGVKSIAPEIIDPFILSFPSLTHLDLSGTRISPALLSQLRDSSTVTLQSLALGRCVKLTGDSIVDFLINGAATRNITELSLYGDATFPSPLSVENLHAIITKAPAFISGKLEYLDLSSSPINGAVLEAFLPQPCLRSLGLSYITDLSIRDVANFLRSKACNVEVLSLISTSPELLVNPRQASIALHSHLIQPLCTPPFRFSITKLATPPEPPATRLRVIELAISTLAGLGAGAGAWRIVRSKGGRGWYVDTASGWIAEGGSKSVLARDLSPNHPLRMELEKLANANGNVGSGVGWHARKMEILHGHGMLGREDGLYGAVSFAYQG